jgi:hypothetical protein
VVGFSVGRVAVVRWLNYNVAPVHCAMLDIRVK